MTGVAVSRIASGDGNGDHNLTWNEECRPADDHEVVFPANVGEAHRSSLQKDQSGWGMLVQLRKAQGLNLQANWPNSEKPMPIGRISVGKISDT